MRKKLKSLILSACLLFVLSSCNENYMEDKLYRSITNGNYQGVYEVLRDYPEIDLENIKNNEITDFSMKDCRALGIALNSGCSNEDEIAVLLIKSGSEVNSTLDYGRSYLMSASPKVADVLIEAGADVTLQDENGMTALDYLIGGAEEAQKEIVYKAMDRLLQHGAKPTATTLRVCLENGKGYVFSKDILKFLQENDIKTEISKALEFAINGDDENLLREVRYSDIPEKDKKYVMLYAARNCSAETLKEMYAEGYLFDVTDDMGNTALDLAARYNGVQEISALAEKGLSINNLKDDGEDNMTASPIINALLSGRQENVDFFMKKGVSIPDNDFENGWLKVCQEGDSSALDILCELGFQPDEEELCEGYLYASYRNDGVGMFDKLLTLYSYDIKDEFGTTLIAQIAGSDEKDAEKLLDLGIQPDVEAISNAIEAGNTELAGRMIRQIPNINLGTPNIWTPLMSAVYYGNYEMVKLLIEKGADVNRVYEDQDGYTYSAVHMAAYCESTDILKYLIEHGGDTSLKNSDGQTPYDLAKKYRMKENMQILK